MEQESGEFDPQALSSTGWVYARAGEPNIGLLEKIAGTVTAKDLAIFDPQALANIVWAYAKAV